MNEPTPRQQFEAEYGQVWDTKELQEDFAVDSFLAPYVFVKRKADKITGSLMFNHNPRFYFNFQPTGE